MVDLPALLAGYENLSARIRSLKGAASEAARVAEQALLLARLISESHIWRRLQVPGVADLLLGVATASQPPLRPAPLASTSNRRRPALNEKAATSVGAWPGLAGQYLANGRLALKSLSGQNVATGLVLTFAEIRAFLIGLTQSEDPKAELLSQYFRVSRGLAVVLHELALRPGLTESEFAAAWRGLFGDQGNTPCPSAGDVSYTPAVPSHWNPVPEKVGSALDQAIARIVALESSIPSGQTWTFTAPAPLLGEGWYVSGSNTLSRALASAAAGPAAADADGVYDGTPNHLGSTSGAVYHMRLEPGSSPVPGQLVYTSYTTAGLFTLVEPAGGSGNYNAVRGKVEDVTGYDPLDPTGSPVLAVWRPTVQVGPV